MSAPPSGVCDICSAVILAPEGYLLVTREVVGEPTYWQHFYRQHEAEFGLMGVRSYEGFRSHSGLRALYSKNFAMQSTPWLVCETCIGMFPVDRPAAHRYAEQWWESGGAFAPPGTGAAPIDAVNMGEACPPNPTPEAA